jgi:hypothetical protein
MRVTQITNVSIKRNSLCPQFAVYWKDRRGMPGMWVFEHYQEREAEIEAGERYLQAQTGNSLRGNAGLQGVLGGKRADLVTVGAEGVDYLTAKALHDIQIAPFIWHCEYVNGIPTFTRIYCTRAEFKAVLPSDAFSVKLQFVFDPVTSPQG